MKRGTLFSHAIGPKVEGVRYLSLSPTKCIAESVDETVGDHVVTASYADRLDLSEYADLLGAFDMLTGKGKKTKSPHAGPSQHAHGEGTSSATPAANACDGTMGSYLEKLLGQGSNISGFDHPITAESDESNPDDNISDEEHGLRGTFF